MRTVRGVTNLTMGNVTMIGVMVREMAMSDVPSRVMMAADFVGMRTPMQTVMHARCGRRCRGGERHQAQNQGHERPTKRR